MHKLIKIGLFNVFFEPKSSELKKFKNIYPKKKIKKISKLITLISNFILFFVEISLTKDLCDIKSLISK